MDPVADPGCPKSKNIRIRIHNTENKKKYEKDTVNFKPSFLSYKLNAISFIVDISRMSDSLYELQSDIQRLALQQTQIQASHSQPGHTDKYSRLKGLSHEL
jgi:hypothetical protein